MRFDCPERGRLWRDDPVHAERIPPACPSCGGDLSLVGLGKQLVEFAKWYRCGSCGELTMKRRGEIVPTKPRTGFEQFA